jgi:bifunctional polynucleotide phosphatase/kinase
MNVTPNPNMVNTSLEMKPIVFQREEDLFYYAPDIITQTHIAAFDIDWTIAYGEKKLFPKEADDIHLLPNRKEKILKLFKMGYTIALFTNQKTKQKLERVARITTLIRKLNIPCFAFIATGDDDCRKPKIGMWNKLKQLIPNIKHSFFVGDALGRPQDFSDSDKLFAVGAGIPHYSPEEFFDHDIIICNPNKNMVITVGMAGSGKSSYLKEFIEPVGFVHVSRDDLGGNKNKVMTKIKNIVKEGKSLAIDATNPRQTEREEYYKIAKDNGYTITVFYFVRDGRGWNDMREGKARVPTMAYHIYFKNLNPPTPENTPGELFFID